MPEGPEVRRYGLDLAEFVSGKTLKGVNILSGRYTKNPVPGLEDAITTLPVKITGVGVHGKFLYWILKNDYYVWNTLGMTGHWSPTIRKHSRVEFCFDDGSVVYFNDQRNFGTIKVVRGRHYLLKKLKTLGPDMLASDVDDNLFFDALRKKLKWPITKALMNQSVIAGVGNYVKADSLWLSRISPHRTVESLSDKELSLLSISLLRMC